MARLADQDSSNALSYALSGLNDTIQGFNSSIPSQYSKPSTPTVTKKKKSSGSRRSGGGGGGTRYGSVGSNRSGTIANTAPPPRMSQAQFLATDTTYKGQEAAYKKAIADYLAQYQAEQNKYNTEYGSAVDKLGLERGEGLTSLKDDYASRGLLSSGVYGEAMNDLNTKFDTQLSDMERAKQAYLNDLLTGKTNYEEEQKLATEKAKQDAINRFLAGG